MRSRFLPYATTPGRLLAQLISDITVAVWTTLWMLVGLAVHDAISIIGEAGRQIEIGSHGIAGNLAAAGQDAQRIPVVGDALSNQSPPQARPPLTSPAPATTWTPRPAGLR